MRLTKHFFLFLMSFFVVLSGKTQRTDTAQKKACANLFKHMKISTYTFPDLDSDGITDQFDKEQKTTKGCPVDTHGVSLDTDGDGVIDCKDKELLTKRDYIPVDSNGIGICPEPDCCRFIFSDRSGIQRVKWKDYMGRNSILLIPYLFWKKYSC